MALREEQVLERITRARGRRARLREDAVTLAHGAGGRAARTLIDAVFKDAFDNPILDRMDDSACFAVNGADLAFTTDAHVVSPLFFPGGDIGDLAVNGTVNDLAVSGATPLHLSAGFILEEGFPVSSLRRITASMSAAAEAAGVDIVTGDTKVVRRGQADGCYITTAGVGVVHSPPAGDVRPGDAILVTGPIGEHGVAIMLARGDLDIEADLASDTAPLNCLLADLAARCPGAVRRMRDATRGGVAAVLGELAADAGLAAVVDEEAVPVRPAVRGACELLGIDPLHVACEGRAVIVVASEAADTALASLRAHPLGAGAAAIGHLHDDPPGTVLVKTAFDGTQPIAPLPDDSLPRIC
ncbi:hydrogenase expression/formation protein HypE [Actinomadura bangladeshensis]|uniref:Hydrogenase expression/formation protein HypE n=1 Tax=Actinomadura bangladeshensis TaxID=453573 RepID=A0A4R4NXF5_9ACTN|nr:hydrogenase expression/formation protein HypE [Actinomadura bangladeshensis]TDC14199.1 hydrogenase expression/formation protein HypE [Actinomadura bangladeshensis]